jgi:hypothetical protein
MAVTFVVVLGVFIAGWIGLSRMGFLVLLGALLIAIVALERFAALRSSRR